MSSRVAYPTAGGDLHVEFGVNRWVLVETADGQSAQRQIGRERDLAALLRELGMTELDARAAAAKAWRERPAEAGLAAARPREAPWRSTGLPAWVVLLVIAIVVALGIWVRLQFFK